MRSVSTQRAGTGTKAGTSLDPKKGWHRILKAAKIKDLHLHDLRRTLGSYMAMTGASLSVIGNALKHKDVSGRIVPEGWA